MKTPALIAACTHQGYIAMYLCNTLRWLEAIQFGLRARHSTASQYLKIQGPRNLKL
jgi:hypothetical protein